jgi:hypothetical protein
MSARITTSFRYSPDESELLDAWAAYLKAQSPHLIRGTHSDAIRHLMKRAVPPAKLGETENRVRNAYTTIFGEPK